MRSLSGRDLRGDDELALRQALCQAAMLRLRGLPARCRLRSASPLRAQVRDDLAREIGQFIQRENSAVCPRQHTIVHGELVAEDVSPARGLDWIEIADDVGDGDVWRRQLLDVTLLRIEPGDRRVVGRFAEKISSVFGDRSKRIVVDFTAGDDGKGGIEQRREGAQDSRFRLTAEAEQNEVVPTE